MSFVSWLRNRPSSRSAGGRAQYRVRPQLGALGNRCLLSTLTVTTNLDSGPGSLRADIAAANPGDTINFAPSLDGQTITLTSGQLFINKSLSIQGPGAGQLAISGNNTSRLFYVNGVSGANTNVMLSGLTITQGNGRGSGPGNGGGILNADGSTLTICGCTLSNNHAPTGGAVYNFVAKLQIVNSTLSGNKANDPNGGGEGGAVYSDGAGNTASMTGCTLSNNSATQEGGGIYVIGTRMTISGCTFSGNVAYNSGAPALGNDIYNSVHDTATMLLISDSVFINNIGYPFDPIIGPWTNGGGNTFN